MTKEELKQYRSIVAELNEVNDRINSNTVHGTVTGSDAEFPYVKHCISVSGVSLSNKPATNNSILFFCRSNR